MKDCRFEGTSWLQRSFLVSTPSLPPILFDAVVIVSSLRFWGRGLFSMKGELKGYGSMAATGFYCLRATAISKM